MAQPEPRSTDGAAGTPARAGDYAVFTPERVSLQFDLAGIGSRAAAALVDSCIQFALYLALLVVFLFVFSPISSVVEDMAGDAAAWLGVAVIIFVVLGLFFLLWGYYLVFEAAWNGQTPGKRLLGIRVIRENGYPIRATDSVVRNLVRVIDAPPFGFVIGVLVMLFNDRAKRLGDFAAGTIVIREGRRQRFEQIPAFAAVSDTPAHAEGATGTGISSGGAAAGMTAAAPPLALAAEDASLVRDFLVRRRQMDRLARAALARRLADHVAHRYGLHLQRPSDDEVFLESLATPYTVPSRS